MLLPTAGAQKLAGERAGLRRLRWVGAFPGPGALLVTLPGLILDLAFIQYVL